MKPKHWEKELQKKSKSGCNPKMHKTRHATDKQFLTIRWGSKFKLVKSELNRELGDSFISVFIVNLLTSRPAASAIEIPARSFSISSENLDVNKRIPQSDQRQIYHK